jgi:hypothetical protein
LDSTKEQRGNRRHLWSGGTGLSGAPPDSVRCTRGLQLKLPTFGNFQRRLHYNSPDCPVYTGHVRCSKERAASGTRQPREFISAAPLKFTGLSGVHRTVRCIHGATTISAPTATCDALNARAARAEVKRAHTGAPDSQQYMSGAPPDIQADPEVRTPTVGIQRHW